jgi:hypothetical protein
MSAMQGIRMKNPAHPGGFVKSEIIEPRSFGDERGASSRCYAGGIVGRAERACASFAGNGAADRKGVRRFDGYAHADAEQL